jgi:hypothetical protein
MNMQAGGDSFRGKGSGAMQAVNLSIEGTEGMADKLSAELDETTDVALPLSSDPVSQLYAALETTGVDQDTADSALQEIQDNADAGEAITTEFASEIVEFDPGFADTRRRISDGLSGTTDEKLFKRLEKQAYLAVGEILRKLHEAKSDQATALTDGQAGIEDAGVAAIGEAGGLGKEEGEVSRAPGSTSAEDLRASQPIDSAYRPTESAVARNYHSGVEALREAGLTVELIEGIMAAGAISPSQRHVQLTLGTLANPNATDMRVLIHEAAHALYATLPQAFREAIHRAIDALPAAQQPDASTNRSLQTDDPVRLAEERLAVFMEGQGINPGDAKGFASRLMRLVADVFYQMAGALARAAGLDAMADAFALRYTTNRLNGLLQGDMAPGSLFNAMGGRPLTFAEKAAMLPGFGRTLGRMVDGAFQWAEKTPSTIEAVNFNLDLAFSAPLDSGGNIPADGNETFYAGRTGSVVAAWRKSSDPTLEAAARISRRIFSTSEAPTGPKQTRSLKLKQEAALRDWAQQNGKLIPPAEFEAEWKRQGEVSGEENQVIIKGGRVLKRNFGHGLADGPLVFHRDWSEFFDRMALHNYLFRDAPLTLEGFMDTEGRLAPIMSQPFVKGTRGATRAEVETLMRTKLGFERTREDNYRNAEGIIVEDLHEENALMTDDGVVVIDPVIFDKSKPSDIRRSQPTATTQPPIGGDNPASAINREVAAINHALAVEVAVETVLGSSKYALAAGPNRRVMAWFREQFHLEDPNALKAAALNRFDPATQRPVVGSNPAAQFGDLAATNAFSAKAKAYGVLWGTFKTLGGRLTALRAELGGEVYRATKATEEFTKAHRDYLTRKRPENFFGRFAEKSFSRSNSGRAYT